jgi:hypothetical protein
MAALQLSSRAHCQANSVGTNFVLWMKERTVNRVHRNANSWEFGNQFEYVGGHLPTRTDSDDAASNRLLSDLALIYRRGGGAVVGALILADVPEKGSYFGLAGLKLDDRPIQFPQGIRLERTYAYLMEPVLMAFAPAEEGKPHPAPWRTTRSSDAHEITAQLYVPDTVAKEAPPRFRMAYTIVFLLRLWSDPSIRLIVSTNMPFQAIAKAEDAAAHIARLDVRRPMFPLGLVDETKVLDSIKWPVANFETTDRLMREDEQFRLAAYALDSGQFLENSTLVC